MSYSSITSNAGFRLIDYATDPYHQDEWFNWKLLDGLLTLTQTNTPYVNATGTGAAFVADYTPDQVLAVGLTLSFKVPVSNTGAVTLAVDGQAAKPIKINGSNPAANTLATGMYVKVVYDGTNFNVVYPSFTALGSNIITAGVSGATADPLADSLVVEDSTNIGLSLLSPDGTTGRLYFGSVTKPDGGGLVYDHAINRLYLRANQFNGPYLDADKVIRQPARPGVYAYKTYTAAALPASAAQILFDNEGFDFANNYDPVTSTFNAPFAGTYKITVDFGVTGSAAVNHVIGVYKNGVLLGSQTISISTSQNFSKTFFTWAALVAGDLITVKMVTNGGASNISGNALLTIELLA